MTETSKRVMDVASHANKRRAGRVQVSLRSVWGSAEMVLYVASKVVMMAPPNQEMDVVLHVPLSLLGHVRESLLTVRSSVVMVK